MDRLADRHAEIQRHHVDPAIARLDAQHRVEGRAHRTTRQRWSALGVHAHIPGRAIGSALIGIAQARHVAGRPHHPLRIAFAILAHVKGPARKPAANLALIALDAPRLAHEAERIGVRKAQVEMDQIAIVKGVDQMKSGDAGASAEPAHLLHLAIARHDADPALQLLLMRPMRAASLEPLKIGGCREDREDRVFFTDREVVNG